MNRRAILAAAAALAPLMATGGVMAHTTRCNPGHGKNLAKCSYAGENLDGADFHSSNLYQANFTDASLVGADLHSANLSKANFTNADLTGADLHGANTGGAIFCNTIMPDGTINNDGC